MFRQNADFAEFVEYIALLDSRTTAICRARNGKLMKLDSTELAGNTPPLHYHSRSILSPVSRYGVEDMQAPGWKDPDGNTLPQKMEWADMPQPQKGFGSVGRVVDKASSAGDFGTIKKAGDMTEGKKLIIENLFSTKKINLPENVLSDVHTDVNEYFRGKPSNVVMELKKILSRFPERLLEYWDNSHYGNVTIVPYIEKRYCGKSGSYNRRTREARITAASIANDNGCAEEEITHMLDHLLGSKGEKLYGTLSIGFGINERIKFFGKEIFSLYRDKNNYIDGYASSNPREYLAQSVRYYLSEPELLQMIVPKVYNVIEAKWFNNSFWKEAFDESL